MQKAIALLSQSWSYYIIGIILAIVAAAVMFLFITAAMNKRHNGQSILSVLIVTLVLLILNIRFGILLNEKDALDAYQSSIEYRLRGTGTELASSVSPEISDWITMLLGENKTPETIAAERHSVVVHLWITGLCTFLFFALGLWLASAVAVQGYGAASRTSGRASYSRSSGERSGSRSARTRHRS